jgi:hypothetical protein
MTGSDDWFVDHMVRRHTNKLDVERAAARRKRLAEMTPRRKTGQDVSLRIKALFEGLTDLGGKDPRLVIRAFKSKRAMARLMHRRLGYASEEAAEKFLRRRLPMLWKRKTGQVPS